MNDQLMTEEFQFQATRLACITLRILQSLHNWWRRAYFNSQTKPLFYHPITPHTLKSSSTDPVKFIQQISSLLNLPPGKACGKARVPSELYVRSLIDKALMITQYLMLLHLSRSQSWPSPEQRLIVVRSKYIHSENEWHQYRYWATFEATSVISVK